MNVIIKQKEIEAGIKLYLLQQGIQLNGKTTEISFTAGRKDSGLSAEIEINDVAGALSVVDAMIGLQAPIPPVIEIPEVVVTAQAVELLTSPAEVLEAAKALNIEGVPEKLEHVFMHDAMTAEEEVVAESSPQAEVAVDVVAETVATLAPVTPAPNPFLANLFSSAVATSEPAEVVDPPFDVDEEEALGPVVAPAVKSISLFG